MNLDFINFSFYDILDIVLVAVLLHYIYKLLKGTVAINIVIGIIFIFLIWKLTALFQMQMLSGILGYLLSGGVIALIIVFQQEIRKFLLMIGTTNFSSKGFFSQIKFLQSEINTTTDGKVIIETCQKLAKTKTGVLLVLERTNKLDFIANSGDTMNALVNQPILESIFYKNSPLHDGATIIRDNHIIATRVILPVSDSTDIPARFGLRHRAGIGVTEKTDAVCILVSEETGEISYIKDGSFVLFKDNAELIEKLNKDLSE